MIVSALDRARRDFRDELLASGMLVDAGQPGLFARSGAFDGVVAAVGAVVTRSFADLGAEILRFPPVFPRREFEKTDYIAAFPHLTGAVHGFRGSDRDHRELLAARSDGSDWDGWLEPADVMLAPAVCHPFYGRLAGGRIERERLVDLDGWCFRYEPSDDPMRLQAFRMRELAFVGVPAEVRRRRDELHVRQVDGLRELGLDARSAAANDPFFGRSGRMLSRNQRDDGAKLEVLVPIYGDLDEGTAIASANDHGDHFGRTFDFRTVDGAVGASGCLGWGLDRIALALLRTHGMTPPTWPRSVLSALELEAVRG